MKNQTPAYLNVKAVAKHYDVSLSTVWRWTNAGRLPQPIRCVGLVRWEYATLPTLEEIASGGRND